MGNQLNFLLGGDSINSKQDPPTNVYIYQMITSQKNLAKRLLYLPLDLNEKVLLWLAYRGLKPVSDITVQRRNMALLRRGIKTSPPNIKNKINRIEKWIHEAGLFYATELGHLSSWHVGRDKHQTALSAKLLHRFDYGSEYQTGILFGFPEESAKAYAHNRGVKLGERQIPMVMPGHQSLHPYLKNKYFLPYIFYSIRADNIKEDSQVAKLWADTIRKETPILAKWYEDYRAKQRKRESKWNNKWKLIIKRDNQSAKQIIAEYSKEAKTIKEILQNILREFSQGYLDDFQLASICYELRKRMTVSDKRDKELLAILKVGEEMWVPGKSIRLKTVRIRVKRLLNWYSENCGPIRECQIG